MQRLPWRPGVIFFLALGLLAPGSANLPLSAQPALSAQHTGTFQLPCKAVAFSEIAREAGLAFRHIRGGSGAMHLPETMGSGLAWLDFDGDGWMDLYLVQSGPFPPTSAAPRPDQSIPPTQQADAGNRLYRNLGDGTFEDWTARSGGAVAGYGQGVTAADVDGNGFPDLYLTQFGPDRLLLNQGNGTFRDATAEAGIDVGGWSSSAAFADADGDGDLDLYVTRYLDYDPEAEIFCGDPEAGARRYCDPSLFTGSADVYLRNETDPATGKLTFRDRTREAGLDGARGRGLGVLFTDLDGDDRPDLYVANDLTLNLFFHNLGPDEGGTVRFEDLSLLSGLAVSFEGKPEAGMGLAVGDVDGDGSADLAVTNFDVETNTLYRNLGGSDPDGAGDLIGFEDVSAASGFGPPSFNLLGFGLAFADLDLDGDLDAWAANGHIFEDPSRDNVAYAQPDLLLLGDGRGGFSSEACGVMAEGAGVGRGLAVADFDNDGDPDVAVSHSDGPVALYRNDGGPEHGTPEAGYLGLLFRDQTGAVGAKATLRTGATTTTAEPSGKQGTTTQPRWVTAGDSYQSTSDPRPLWAIPLGHSLEEIEIAGPAGGDRALRLHGAPRGSYLTIPTIPKREQP